MSSPIHTLPDAMKIDAKMSESARISEALDPKESNLQSAVIGPLPSLVEEPWVRSEDEFPHSEKDSVDGEELETFSPTLVPITESAESENAMNRRARNLVQEAWSMPFTLVEAANMGIEPAYKAFCVEEPPHMLKAMELAKANYESLEREEEMLENHDESNTTQKANAKCV